MFTGTVTHYQILNKLGEGGMGEVYLAEDQRLGRQVALKFLPASFQYDPERRARFLQEARAASALRSPYVAAIYDIGEHEGSQFIAMEFVDGELLAHRIERRAFTLREAIDVAVQVAEALDEAHHLGIVHRDIKSSNVMITGRGFVKVLDFGLAKILRKQAGDDEDKDRTLIFGKETSPGMVLGTAAYMSPEQARGLAVDGRSDLFSLGVLLYEMVTGRKPFTGATISDLLVAILDRDPLPVSHFAAEMPPQLEWIITKALRKKCEERYQTAKELSVDLKNLLAAIDLESSLAKTRAIDPRSDSLNPQTVSLDAATIKLSDSPSTGPASPPPVTRKRRSRKAINSIAILPLVNASPDTSMDYLSDGITETLINNLSRLPKLRVMARSTTFRYKGRDVDPMQVGNELGVRAVLTGRVLQINDNLIVGTELVDVSDGAQLWGEQYHRHASDIFSLQEEISNEILDKLRVKLGAKEKRAAFNCCTASTEAYELYLKGRFHWNKWTPEGFLRAIEFFEQAVEKDSRFALAYAGLSDSYGALWFFNFLPASETLPNAEAYALRALALDDSLAEAHLALGNMELFHKWNWQAADRAYRRALELNPNFAAAYHMRSIYLITLGRFDEALAAARRAVEIDPLSPMINCAVSGVLFYYRRYDEAIENLKRVIDFDPNFNLSYEWLTNAYELNGMADEAMALRRSARMLWTPSQDVADLLQQTYAESGIKGFWRKWLEIITAQDRPTHFSDHHIAVYYSFIGEIDRAFEWLEKAYEKRSGFLVYLNVDPRLDPLRGDPRFADLVRRVGIPPQ